LSKEYRISDERLACMMAQIFGNHGSRVMPRINRYQLERKANRHRLIRLA